MKQILTSARRFLRDDCGAVLAETMIVLPALFWAFLGTYVYFDAFSSQNTSIKAAYTIADLISRQTNTLTPTDIEGMNKIFDAINNTATTGATSHIRVSDVTYDYDNKVYKVIWSDATRGFDKLTDTSITNYETKLPQPAYGDTEIVVETWITFTPAFNVGLGGEREFHSFVVTRPRMSPNVDYYDPNAGA